MNRLDIITAEDLTLNLIQRLREIEKNSKLLSSDDRDYIGTLWVNLQTLAKVCNNTSNALDNRFKFE